MKFLRTLSKKMGRVAGNGSMIIADGFLKIIINDNTVHIKEMGIANADGDIGVVVEKDDVARKTNHIVSKFKYNENDLPVNFQGFGYRFTVPAEKVSETEYLFRLCNAKMLNKK